MKSTAAFVLILVLLVAAASPSITAPDEKPPELPAVGSYENFKALIMEAQKRSSRLRYFNGLAEVMPAGEAASDSKAAPLATEYSATNVQVQGVDEADIVKTDGRYIYSVSGRRLAIVKTGAHGELELVKVINCDDGRFTPSGLYVDDKHLVVIGSGYHNPPFVYEPKKPAVPEVYPPRSSYSTVRALIYDISDMPHIKELRDVELEGNYVSSRKIGSAVYLVANRYIDYYEIMKHVGEADTPAYRDSAAGDGFKIIDYPDIKYFPGFITPNYLIVAGIDLDHPENQMNVSAYLGAGENIYASVKNLYVAVSRPDTGEIKPAETGAALTAPPAPPEIKTFIYRFALNRGNIVYTRSGEVPGGVLNQFSMDEYKGFFRVATTTGEIWRDDEHTSKNNIYILNEMLETTGNLEGIAPGEKIYSARFTGDRAYMVTFRTVDPLFVIDLKDPKAPKILGALKIPGYSDYLHPYDDNHIIGFGKDTVEISPKVAGGFLAKPQAFYLGLKITLFDVTDVTRPVEKFKEVIGDRGTDSELLHDHKALLFSREKNLLAFPVTVMEASGDSTGEGGIMPRYGEFAFQGAYVYGINLKDGFVLRGKLTHLSGDDFLKSGRIWYSSSWNIKRILYIGDSLYTVSDSMIKAHDLGSLKEEHSVIIP